VLLCTQVSLRANFISALIPATLKLSYDKASPKDFHSFFIDRCITSTSQQRVLDSFCGFIEHLRLRDREMRGKYKIPDEAHEFGE